MPRSGFSLILNPAAGRGAAARALREIRAMLDAAGAEYDVLTTRAAGHAAELAERAAREGASAVIAVGGDGTVHEVANGLMHAAGGESTVPLGIIPVGSGNDFAKLAGVPAAPGAATRHLLDARPRWVDVGRVGERYFVNGVGVGFDGQVAIEARKVRRLRGIAVYAWAVLRVLRTHRTPSVHLVLDGEAMEPQRVTLVTAGNGGCHGGGFWICPRAEIDDGWLDVCVAGVLTRTQVLRLIPRVMRGTHLERREVKMHRARRIDISSPDPLPVHADGEIIDEAAHEVEIELLPGRLTVLA